MSCERFEQEGLLLLEQGKPLGEHFDTCEDCLAARRLYERLRQRLGELPEHQPSADWQAKVWQAIDDDAGQQTNTTAASVRPTSSQASDSTSASWWRRRHGLRYGAMAAALAACLVFVLLRNTALLRNPASPPTPQVALEVSWRADADQTLRGDDAHPGDRLTLHATTGTFSQAELRLYRDEELVFACSDQPPCQLRKDTPTATLEATFELPAIGLYQPLLVVSDRPIPAAAGSFDADTGTLYDGGFLIQLGREIAVR